VTVDVSIVMPVWRPHVPWLRAAVESALRQRDCDLELIIVDDGNDVAVAELLADVTDQRIRHLRMPHAGVSAARNAGLAVMAGTFVRFADADDVLELGSTARLRALATEATIAYEDTLVCDEELRPLKRISSRLTGDIAVACLLGQFDSRHVSMLFPARVVQTAGRWDTRLRVREDFDFVLRCVENAPVVPGEGTAAFYRRHDASATKSQEGVEEAQRSTRLILTGFFSRHPELRGSRTEREAWRRVVEAEAGAALHRGRLFAAVRLAAPLMRLAPRQAAAIYLRAGRSAVRISGAASFRTTVRVLRSLRRRAHQP
jgi:glycosyltransferase involved in cell wall biosynthesis